MAGGLCLLLAFFAFQVLPVDTSGLLLIVFGIALLILELKMPSFGALGIGGAASLLIGSLMVTRNVPGVQVGLGTILPAVAVLAGGILLLGRLALTAQRQPPVTGVEGLIGATAQARAAMEPGVRAPVAIHGELWQAISPVPVEDRALVRVTAVDGLTLTVAPDSTLSRAGDNVWKS